MVWNFGGGSAHRFFLWLTSPEGWKSVPNRVVFVDSGSYSLVKFTKLKRIQMGKDTFSVATMGFFGNTGVKFKF
jgi:hypothetical protein